MTFSYPFLAGLFLVPFAISLLLTFFLVRWAPRMGLVDHPGERKVHTQPTPRGGGLAIYAGLAAAALLFPSTLQRELLTSLGAGLVIVILGLIDDLHPLPWQLRLGVQIATTGFVIAIWPAEGLSWWVRVLSVLWIAGLVNAFNMLDNMDALSGGIAWIAAGILCLSQFIASGHTQEWPALPCLMLMGALSGFLWFNRPPARIFMGDAGSTFLGFFLGLSSLHQIYSQPIPSATWAVPLCVLAVPCYDMLSVIVLRLWQGKSPFHADKQHLSHRLVALGLSSAMAVRLIYLMGLASGAAGLVLYQATGWWALLIAIAMVSWWLTIAGIEYFRHFKSALLGPVSNSPAK